MQGTVNVRRKLSSLKDKHDSLKTIEKQKDAFKVFRATNAFRKRLALPSASNTAGPADASIRGTTSQVVMVVSDGGISDSQQECIDKLQIDDLRSFVNYVNQKFSFIGKEVPDASFITNDNYYLDNLPMVTETSGTIREGVPLDVQFVFRTKWYQVLVDNHEIFCTLNKMLELHLLRGWIEPDPDKDDRFIIRYICASMAIFLVNGTDCHPGFAEAFCNEPGVLEILVLFIREKRNATQENTEIENDEWTWQTITFIVQIFYNCSMIDTNRGRLRETGALQASLPFIDSEDHDTGLVALLTVAYLADENQSKVFRAKRGPVEYLIKRVEEAVQSEEKRDRTAWTATELINGLGRLALNDTNKSLIAECGAVPILLTQAREDGSPNEQLDATEVIWTLTFDDNLKKAGYFKDALELFGRLANEPDHICYEAAKGILWNLKEIPTPDHKFGGPFRPLDCASGPVPHRYARGRVEEDGDLESDVPFIMISYQWDSQEVVLKIKEALEAHGYKVWIDVEKMAGSILEAMAEAVEGARLVLVCCSQKYKDSQNCRAEAEYTFKKKKEFIPLILEKRYSPDGWLGIMLGTKMYYNFTSDGFDAKLQELVRAIGNRGKITKKDIPPPKLITVPEKATTTYSSPPKPAPRTPQGHASPKEVLTPRDHSQQGETQASQTLQLQKRDVSDGGMMTHQMGGSEVAAILSRRQDLSDLKNWDEDKVNNWMEVHKIDKECVGHLTGSHLYFLRTMKQDAPAEYYKCIQTILRLTTIDQMAALTNALEEL